MAQDLLPQLVREEKADIVNISEEYRDLQDPSWVRDSTSKADIWVCGSLHISCKMATPLPNFTWVEVAGVRIYSCYLPPGDNIKDFTRFLDAIVTSAQSSWLPERGVSNMPWSRRRRGVRRIPLTKIPGIMTAIPGVLERPFNTRGPRGVLA
ncbi:hypothetical protein TSAR_013620 [Trichomalopsis sarcophagae]|uniref:Uncharacterized protein n=1 Tax=Trichomalopsis sarcophagae TaxID=543379 RepID=A0A232ELN3_9HYME|nr:hypothetical protein TSAR_013620 [Trichomalopsis sarcophagae]